MATASRSQLRLQLQPDDLGLGGHLAEISYVGVRSSYQWSTLSHQGQGLRFYGVLGAAAAGGHEHEAALLIALRIYLAKVPPAPPT